MKILITGANGFIGKNICEFLCENHPDYGLLQPSHKDLELADSEKVEEFLKKNRPDIVIHCAASGSKRHELNNPAFLESNLRCFFNLARCSRYYKRMIFLGSGAEYDKSKALSEVKESDFDRRIPKDPYGVYKYVCSKYIEESRGNTCNRGNMVSLKLFGVFGKYEDKSRFISSAIIKSVLGEPISMNKNVLFDYLYVVDLAKIIDHFITHEPKHRSYNVGSGKKTDLLSIAKEINRISGSSNRITVKEEGLGNEYSCNIQRLSSEVKIEYTDMKVALKELYRWYDCNRSGLSAD
ncbi:MAG: NAD-dependent epimerase/dehydratase family protein [Candidatus Woesearchaeota archaeon]|nr:NAD-dependent epimerase/dehydratase family protein [Candidatus Woesearchaeota archaeon]